MKAKLQLKKVLVICWIVVPITLSAQDIFQDPQDIPINATNFPDENFRAYLLKQWYGEDGIIDEKECREIDDIRVGNRNIESLKGIEHFPNLKVLYCYSNNLTSLDLSQNTALEVLDCRDNQLSALDVSVCIELVDLDCDNNKFVSLDVSKNTQLNRLYCSWNQLSSLDVSHNVELAELDFGHNKISSLDVSHNTKLTKLACYDDYYLTTLDVSKNTALTIIYCPNNQLTELDVSKNTELTELHCNGNLLEALDISQNTKLRTLECSYNQLTLLDVSKNAELVTLSCNNNQLDSLDISQNIELFRLNCSDNLLDSLDISQNIKLQNLNCSDNMLESLDVSQNIALTELYCARNQIQGGAMDAFIQSLPQNTMEQARKVYIYNIYKNYHWVKDEGNVCTSVQVEVIKSKGWMPYYYDIDSRTWLEYDGTSIGVPDNITQLTIESIDKHAPVYNLAGQRIESLQNKKGIYIVGGKKVLVK